MQISPEGKIGIGLTLLFGIGAGAVAAWPEQHWIGVATMICSGAGLSVLGVHQFSLLARFGRLNWILQSVLIFIALFGAFAGVMHLHSIPADSRTELRQRFDTDFPNTYRHSRDITISQIDRRNNHTDFSVTIRRTTYTDIGARTAFIGFYIPASPYTYAVCDYLARQWKPILDESRREVLVQTYSPNDVDRRSLNDFPVSGRVYIYHELSLSLRERVQLSDEFKATGGDIEFVDPRPLRT